MISIITSDKKHKAEIFDSETAVPTLEQCVKSETDKMEKANCANKLGLIYGEGFLGKTNLKKAVLYYEIAYELEPDNSLYAHNLGLAYYNMGAYHTAVPLLKKCVKKDFEGLSIYNKVTCASKLGWIYAEGKLGRVDLKGAFNNYKFANQFEPENEVFAFNLAHCANSLGIIYQKGKEEKINLNKALKYYKIAYKLQPSEMLYNKHLADVQYQLGHYKQAEILFKRCLKIELTTKVSDSDKADCANSLGAIYSSKKLFNKAIQSFTNAHEFAPHDPAFIHNLANSYLKIDNYQKAKDLFIQCAEADLTDHFTMIEKENCLQGVELCNVAKDDL